MKNPIMAASGTFGYGEEYKDYIPINRLGALITKGISLKPHSGNPPPRLAETTGGMLNAIGLQNVGIKTLIEEKIPKLKKFGIPIIVNIFGTTIKEYGEVAKALEGVNGIAGLEVNISCPNLKRGGICFGTDPREVFKVVNKVRKSSSHPIMVKLSPNVTDITVIARSAEEAGANAISLINTLIGMAIDVETRTPKLGNTIGGLSGPAIKPIALRMVWEVYNKVNIPIVGVGGIFNAHDALEFIIAGASAVQIGTAHFINPRVSIEVIVGLENYLKDHQINTIQNLVGSLESSTFKCYEKEKEKRDLFRES
ncbi:MAG: dihydroorotate dehydrogenase [Deltaproteobacteria bacterium DG_8]|nr:MAG: dihydroorotate dehydrogenase [Deltaproteobacteria bacterium DG_8]